MRVLLPLGPAFERLADGGDGLDQLGIDHVGRGALGAAARVDELENAHRSDQPQRGQLEQAVGLLHLRLLEREPIALQGAEYLLDAPAQPVEPHNLLCVLEPRHRQRRQEPPVHRLDARRRAKLAHLDEADVDRLRIGRGHLGLGLCELDPVGPERNLRRARPGARAARRHHNPAHAEVGPSIGCLKQPAALRQLAVVARPDHYVVPFGRARERGMEIALPVGDMDALDRHAEAACGLPSRP